MLNPSMTPESLLALWHRATLEQPLPYKTDDDVVLNMLTGPSAGPGAVATQPYKYADQIPKLAIQPRYPPEVARVVDFLLKSGKLERAYKPIADGLAKVCDTAVLTPAEWQPIATRYTNMMCVLFDPQNIHYSARANRLLMAPVQVTVGMVCVLAVRGYVSTLAPDLVYTFDIRFARKGSSTYENYPYTGKADGSLVDKICHAAERILQDQGTLKVPEIET